MKIYASTSEDKKHKILESLVGKDLWIKATVYNYNYPIYLRVVKKLPPAYGFDYVVNRVIDTSNYPSDYFYDSIGRILLDETTENVMKDEHWIHLEDIRLCNPVEIYTFEELFFVQ